MQILPQLELNKMVRVGAGNSVAVREGHAMPPVAAIWLMDQILITRLKDSWHGKTSSG
jgi:hypothetical protein